MPIYEYYCKECENQYESLILSTTNEDPPGCPLCGTRNVHKIISSSSIIRSQAQRNRDRFNALGKADPAKPQEVARVFQEHGSRFGERGFRSKKAWRDAVDRVSKGGAILEE